MHCPVTVTKLKIVFLLLPALMLLRAIYAQDGTLKMKPYQIKNVARVAAESGDIFTAIDLYEAYLKERPGNKKVQHELGNLY